MEWNTTYVGKDDTVLANRRFSRFILIVARPLVGIFARLMGDIPSSRFTTDQMYLVLHLLPPKVPTCQPR